MISVIYLRALFACSDIAKVVYPQAPLFRSHLNLKKCPWIPLPCLTAANLQLLQLGGPLFMWLGLCHHLQWRIPRLPCYWPVLWDHLPRNHPVRI